MNISQILGQLANVRKSGSGWASRCPSHEDKKNSLSITEGNDGRTLLKCFAGCTFEEICAAKESKASDLFARPNGNGNGSRKLSRRIASEYDYRSESGELLYQIVRYEPKDFRQRRPDGKGGWTWKLDGVRRVPYRLSEVLAAHEVLVCEGEKDCDTARKLGLVATCNPGGAGQWREEYSEPLSGKHVAIIADADESGRRHAQQVAQSLHGKAVSVKVLELPSAKDLSEWVERGGTRETLLEQLIRNAPQWKPQEFPSADKGNRVNPWSLAVDMDTFLDGEEEAVDFLFPPVIAREAVTEIFSPRGLGKSLWALFVAVFLALAGRKVLLIDRDNPRRLVKDRLRSFGATRDLSTLKILSRENAPPLTNGRAWAEFPYFDYDLVIVDFIDSAAEGIGEQDSTKPSLAIAPLLDIARRENGPAVLLLGNTIKSAAHSRGSGVIEDRADIVFEVRDATNLHPTGKKPWIEELPAADAGSWMGRSTRRKQLSRYRLAFIATKFRVGEEPEPFIIEIDLTTEPWRVRNVTDLVDREGAESRTRLAQEKEAAVTAAAESLKAEIFRREAAGEPALLKKKAEEFLTSRDITQKIARAVISSPTFETAEIPGKGHPKVVRLAGKKDIGNRNITPMEPAIYAASSDGDFGCPHPEHTTEIPSHETRHLRGFQSVPISVESTLFTPPEGQQSSGRNDDDEVSV